MYIDVWEGLSKYLLHKNWRNLKKQITFTPCTHRSIWTASISLSWKLRKRKKFIDPYKIFFQCTEKRVEAFNNPLPMIGRRVFAKGSPSSQTSFGSPWCLNFNILLLLCRTKATIDKFIPPQTKSYTKKWKGKRKSSVKFAQSQQTVTKEKKQMFY